MNDLFDDLETLARRHSQRLEDDGRLDYGFTAEHYPLTPSETRELERLKAAMLLATDAATYVDLANGRTVPRHRLNPDALHLLERWAA